MGPSLPARADHDRPVPLAAYSPVRSSPEHEAPISARNVCENPRDKPSCRARFHDLFRRSGVLRLLAQRKCPIHVRQFAVSTTVPQRFGKKRPPGVLFRLAPINLQLGLHGSAPRTAGPGSTCRCSNCSGLSPLKPTGPTSERAARLGDGWMPIMAADAQAEQKLRMLREQLKSFGRDPAKFGIEAWLRMHARDPPRLGAGGGQLASTRCRHG